MDKSNRIKIRYRIIHTILPRIGTVDETTQTDRGKPIFGVFETQRTDNVDVDVEVDVMIRVGALIGI